MVVFKLSAQLLLGGDGHWWGTGKWLMRELETYDVECGTRFVSRLHDGMLAAIHGEPDLLVAAADEILDAQGGRLWAGYRVGG
jgi:hypothetical protein